jgi:hypothetical protein
MVMHTDGHTHKSIKGCMRTPKNTLKALSHRYTKYCQQRIQTVSDNVHILKAHINNMILYQILLSTYI